MAQLHRFGETIHHVELRALGLRDEHPAGIGAKIERGVKIVGVRPCDLCGGFARTFASVAAQGSLRARGWRDRHHGSREASGRGFGSIRRFARRAVAAGALVLRV